MFDILPNTLSLVLTTLLPIYAAHKALSAPPTSDATSTQSLAPWLTYFLLLSITSLVDPFISVLPFSAYLRLFVRLWLLLPGESQGASLAYKTYVQPFLHQHERDVESFINDVHDQSRKLVAQWMRTAVEWVKMQLLGQSESQARATPQEVEAKREIPYSQRLLALFNGAPTSQAPAAATSEIGDDTIQGVPAISLGNALQQATAALAYAASASNSASWPSVHPSPHNQTEPTNSITPLIPTHLSTIAERLGYVAAQKERLRVLLGAFEREEASAASLAPSGDLKKSASEIDFDRIEHEDVPAITNAGVATNVRPGVEKTKSWGAWMWGGKAQGVTGKHVSKEIIEKEKPLDEEGTGMSSAVEL